MEDNVSPVTSDNDFQHGYGWRARIGMIVPGIVDETASKQFYRMAPAGVTLVKTSLSIRELTVDDVTAALARVEDAARELGRRKVDCVILGGSPPVLVGGYGSDRLLAERVERAAGVQACAAQTAAVEAMSSLGMRRLAVATPFNDEFNARLKDFLEHSGFTVRCIRSLGVRYQDLMRTPLRAGYELGRECFAEAGDADGIYFPGAPFPIVDVIDALERELSTGVVTSLQASLWKGMALAGAAVPIHGFGRLLRGVCPSV
jgi:maleate isomerase